MGANHSFRSRAWRPGDPVPEWVVERVAVEPLDEEVDHVRGPARGRLILEYGDYECPYSRQAYRVIGRLATRLPDRIRFAFRHFPLTEIHPHAASAAAAAEAAARQDRFWEMHDLLFHRQKALEPDDLRGYASEVGLDLARFGADYVSDWAVQRIARDIRSGFSSGQVLGTPTLFIDGVLHEGGHDEAALLAAVN